MILKKNEKKERVTESGHFGQEKHPNTLLVPLSSLSSTTTTIQTIADITSETPLHTI